MFHTHAIALIITAALTGAALCLILGMCKASGYADRVAGRK